MTSRLGLVSFWIVYEVRLIRLAPKDTMPSNSPAWSTWLRFWLPVERRSGPKVEA